MKAIFSRVSRHAAVLAALLFAAMVMFAGRIEGYSHLHHPLALLGAPTLPRASWFNVLGFVVPGVLVAWVALRLRGALAAGSMAEASWGGRVGAQLLLISALAFAMQGLLPLDPNDFDGVRSGRHAAAWMMWWIAFAAGGVSLAAGLRRATDWRPVARLTLLAALLLPVLALVLPRLVPAGVAQRLAYALWFAWAIHAAWQVDGRTGAGRRQP